MSVFRRAKSVAAQRGIPLREFLTEAVKDKLAADAKAGEKPWVKYMGKLKHLRKETARIDHLIEEIPRKSTRRCGVDFGYKRPVGRRGITRNHQPN